MPRAADLSTASVKKHIARLAVKLEKGDMDTKRGSASVTAWKAVIYANQVEATEKRIEIDERLAESMEQLHDISVSGGKSSADFPPFDIEEALDNEKITEPKSYERVSESLPKNHT